MNAKDSKTILENCKEFAKNMEIVMFATSRSSSPRVTTGIRYFITKENK